MNYKFPKALRLRKRTLFKQVYEQGRYLSNSLISLHFFLREHQEHRIGFAAGKRLGNAVTRNRCRRRLKECYRLYRDEMPVGVDIVVLARKGMVAAEWINIVAAFRDIMRKANYNISKRNRSNQ